MKVEDIIPFTYRMDFIRIHEAPSFEVSYAGPAKDVPVRFLDRDVRRVSAELSQDSFTFNYRPTLVILLEEVDD